MTVAEERILNTSFRFRLTLAFLSLTTVQAMAQWTLTGLNPAGSNQSDCFGGGGFVQAGVARIQDVDHAALWNGTADSFVDLHPSWAATSFALGSADGQQVGVANTVQMPGTAVMWTGSAASCISLNPPGFWDSKAWGVSHGQQVGYVRNNSYIHACLWRGSAGSIVDLNPVGYASSTALATDGSTQVGSSDLDSVPHAGLWRGTAASWVDLNPDVNHSSIATGVGDGQQVGYCYSGDALYPHAALWSGTAASWVDLNPTGATTSQANAVCEGRQVGTAIFNGRGHAMIWNGSPDSWVDLDDYLPFGYSGATPKAIWRAGNTIYIAGHAGNSVTHLIEAVMWSSWSLETVAPVTFVVNLGKVSSGNVTSLGQSDSDALVICKFLVPNQASPIIDFYVTGNTTLGTQTSLAFRVASKMLSAGTFTQSMSLFNFKSGTYEETRTDTLNQAYQTFEIGALGSVSRYVGAGGALKSQIQVRQIGVSAQSSPCAAFDLANWLVSP